MKTSTKLWMLIAGFLLMGSIPSLAQRGYFYTPTFTKDATSVTDEPIEIRITVKYKLVQNEPLKDCSVSTLPSGTIPDYVETKSVRNGEKVEFNIPKLDCTEIKFHSVEFFSAEKGKVAVLGRFDPITRKFDVLNFTNKTNLLVTYDSDNSNIFTTDANFILKEYSRE